MRKAVSSRVFLLVLECALAASVAFAAQPAPQNLKPQGYVNDFAGVVKAPWKERIERLCATMEQKTGAQIAVVTVRSLDGEPIEDFTNRLFIAWGVGHKKDNKGALLLLAVQDRRSRLEVGYGLEPMIPDGYAGSVLREMRPALREGRYGEALYAGVYRVASRIAEKSGVRLEQDTGLPRPGDFAKKEGGKATPLPIPLRGWIEGVAGLLFVLLFLPLFFGPFLLLFWLARRRTGSSWHRGVFPGGWSGGTSSFGGFESSGGGGGGFGGFGGGDSGGGGASSDW